MEELEHAWGIKFSQKDRGQSEDQLRSDSQGHKRKRRPIWWNSDPNKSQQAVPLAVAAWM